MILARSDFLNVHNRFHCEREPCCRPRQSGSRGRVSGSPRPSTTSAARARPNPDRLPTLRTELERDAFIHLKPFGRAITESLLNARVQPDGLATWEEEDYCHPPLAEERAAVL